MGLLERLQHIEGQVVKLKELNFELEQENNELSEANAQLTDELNKAKQALVNLEETNKISKLAEGVNHDEGRRALREQIDQLIKEVDHCLNLVKKHDIENNGL